jgi:hypothetical protein
LLQAALLEHAARFNLKTVMTFHQRVEEAAAFAAKLPETAAELYTTQPSDHALAEADTLPASSIDAQFYDLEPHRHVPPDRVWAQWLCGDHLVSERRGVLRQFANGIDADSKRVHRAFLASVRVLGEGVDIVGERGVEAICFADTRGSQVEIVQNIGRALRPNPDGTTKVARIEGAGEELHGLPARRSSPGPVHRPRGPLPRPSSPFRTDHGGGRDLANVRETGSVSE